MTRICERMRDILIGYLPRCFSLSAGEKRVSASENSPDLNLNRQYISKLDMIWVGPSAADFAPQIAIGSGLAAEFDGNRRIGEIKHINHLIIDFIAWLAYVSANLAG